MIAKCVALLAVVAQINGYVCNSPVVTSGYGTSGILGSGLVGSSGLVVGSSGLVESGGFVGTSDAIGAASNAVVAAAAPSRNIVAKGKYPVALDNTGPVPDPRVPVSTSHVQAPVQEKPTVRLSARIPAPRTVGHSCTCYKQILRPRVHDQYITVPTVQRYIETTHTPVVENIHYEAVPVNSPSTYATSGTLSGGQLSSAALHIASASSLPEALPVSAAVETVPVSVGVETLPISSGYNISPVASSLQIASSAPVRSLPSGCGSQNYYY